MSERKLSSWRILDHFLQIWESLSLISHIHEIQVLINTTLELKKQHIRLGKEKTFRRFLIRNIDDGSWSHHLFFNCLDSRLLNLSRSLSLLLLLLINDHLMFVIFLFFCVLSVFFSDSLIVALRLFFLFFCHIFIYFFCDWNARVFVVLVYIFRFLNLLLNFSNFLFKFSTLLFIISSLLQLQFLLPIRFWISINVIFVVLILLHLVFLHVFTELTYFF